VVSRGAARSRLLNLASVQFPFGCSSLILLAAITYLALGLLCFAVWRWTADDRWVEDFFKVPGACLLTTFAVIELCFSLLVIREFSADQPMRKAWKLIAFSAACDVVSALCVQVLAAESLLNPLTHMSWWSNSVAATIRQFGLSVGGPFRFALLVTGFAYALRTYRRTGLLARLKAIDWILLSIILAYMAVEAWDVTTAFRHGLVPTPATVIGWPTDPLLWLLLAEALLLYRSVRQAGDGLIGRCWKAFSIGVFLVSLGDIAIWATSRGFLPWPWSALEWYIWLPAASAFALAPAYQLEAISNARAPGHLPSGPGPPPNAAG
jgi:hypothetical protein